MGGGENAGLRPPATYPTCTPWVIPLPGASIGGGGALGRPNHRKYCRSFVILVPSRRGGGGGLSSELRSGRGLHFFLRQLAYGVDPSLGMERLALLGVDWYGMVHDLHVLSSVTVRDYSTEKKSSF